MHHSNKNCIILYIAICGLGPFEKERSLVMKVKYSLGDCELSQVDFGRKLVRDVHSTVKEPKLLYPVGRPVGYPKITDLNKLLKYVPPVYNPFYANLDAVTVSDQQDFDESLSCV